MEASTKAWAVIGLGVVAYEALCPDGQLLSEGADRAIESHPVAVPVAIGIVALHLANILPQRYDPLHVGLKYIKRSQ
jgi:hypothetical protein